MRILFGQSAENRMKWATFKRLTSMFLVNHFFAGTKAFKMKNRLLRMAGYDIGEGTKVVGPLFVSTQLHIGSNCWIGKNFTCNGNGSVAIGDRCDIGPEVTFQTGGHQIGSPSRRAGEGRIFTQKVGDGSWIGGRATILGETAVGQSCVVAGCACVTKDTGDNVLVGGVPAKIIRQLDSGRLKSASENNVEDSNVENASGNGTGK